MEQAVEKPILKGAEIRTFLSFRAETVRNSFDLCE